VNLGECFGAINLRTRNSWRAVHELASTVLSLSQNPAAATASLTIFLRRIHPQRRANPTSSVSQETMAMVAARNAFCVHRRDIELKTKPRGEGVQLPRAVPRPAPRPRGSTDERERAHQCLLVGQAPGKRVFQVVLLWIRGSGIQRGRTPVTQWNSSISRKFSMRRTELILAVETRT